VDRIANAQCREGGRSSLGTDRGYGGMIIV